MGKVKRKGKDFWQLLTFFKVYDIFRFSKCFCVKLRIYIFSTYQLFHPVLPVYLPELNTVYEIILWHFALILIFILLIVFCVFSLFLKGVLVLHFLVFYLFLVLYFLVLYLFYWFSIKSGYYYYYFGCAVWLMRS